MVESGRDYAVLDHWIKLQTFAPPRACRHPSQEPVTEGRMHFLCLRRHSVQTTGGAAGVAVVAAVVAAADGTVERPVEGPAEEVTGVNIGVGAVETAGVVVVPEGGAGRM